MTDKNLALSNFQNIAEITRNKSDRAKIEALQRELESMREKLRWRTDWENIPNGIPFEIKYYDGRIFIGYDEMGHIEYFKKRGFGWREIPDLPEVNHES